MSPGNPDSIPNLEIKAIRNVLGIIVTAMMIGRPLDAGEKVDLEVAFNKLNELIGDLDKR